MVVSSSMHPGTPSYAAAELTWALVLAAMRRLPQQVAALKAGSGRSAWATRSAGRRSACTATAESAVVARYGESFGMNVWVRARSSSRERARSDGRTVAPSKEAFFSESDVISLHLRLVDATRGIVTSDDLARMKPTALLVNTSRAPLIEPGALVAALKSGRPGMAAVDVYEEEPVLDPRHPLLAMDNVRLHAPHRLCHARRVRGPVLGRIRSDRGVRGGHADQRRESERPEARLRPPLASQIQGSRRPPGPRPPPSVCEVDLAPHTCHPGRGGARGSHRINSRILGGRVRPGMERGAALDEDVAADGRSGDLGRGVASISESRRVAALVTFPNRFHNGRLDQSPRDHGSRNHEAHDQDYDYLPPR